MWNKGKWGDVEWFLEPQLYLPFLLSLEVSPSRCPCCGVRGQEPHVVPTGIWASAASETPVEWGMPREGQPGWPEAQESWQQCPESPGRRLVPHR